MITLKDVHNAKNTAITLVFAAVLTFLVSSGKIYSFSINEPVQYQINMRKLTKPEKVVANSMYKTGQTTYKINHGSNPRSRKNFDLFDDISKQHKQ